MNATTTLKYILFFILSFVLIACKKKTTEGENPLPEISNTPEIISVNLNASIIDQFDDIVFVISYRDGNGDLGSINPDQSSIELIDNRDPDVLIFNYHLSPRSPAGSNIAIQGELDIKLNNTILLNENNTEEETTFSIRIIDEEGNWSNTVTSPMVTIRK